MSGSNCNTLEKRGIIKRYPLTSAHGGHRVVARRGSRLTDGGEVVSLTRRQPFTPRKIPGAQVS
jgi:hypothetical protein